LIANTLLELYLKDISEAKKKSFEMKQLISSRKDLIDQAINESNIENDEKTLSFQEKKALEFLTSSSSYDMNIALVICQLHNFKVNYYLCKKFK
jgi:hypothetical protein